MILQNYDNTVEENIENELSFTSNALPILQIRPFDPYVFNDEDFLLPYFVDTYLNAGYEEDKLTGTFTVIVSLDEDTKPESQVRRWKQTTYYGEQIINLGKITELGEHTLSIKSIENSGIASGTEFIKFYVHEHETEDNIVDFSNTERFEASERNVEWDTWSPFWFIRPADSNGYYQPVCIYKYKRTFTCKPGTAIRNIDYSVEFIRENNVLIGIDVKVHGTIEYPNQKDDQSHRPKVTVINLNDSPNNQEGQGYGTYYIRNTCTIDGNTVQLENYLSKDTTDDTLTINDLLCPPRKVTMTASRNKIGIQFLLWACDAYCKQHGKKGFKLPKYDYITSYANGLDLDDTVAINNLKQVATDTITAFDYNINAAQLTSRNDIWFPNKNIIIDFNYSTIRSLNYEGYIYNGVIKKENISSAKIVQIRKGYNVKLKNLYVAGDYCNAIMTTDSGKTSGQARSDVKLARCRFTTLENIRISHGTGYEFTGEIGTQADYYKTIPIFDKFGYIDYNNNEVEVEPLKTNTVIVTKTWDDVLKRWVVSTTEDVGQNTSADEAIDQIINPPADQVLDDGASNVMYTSGYAELGSIVTDSTYNRAFHITNSTASPGFANAGDTDENYLGRYRTDGDAIFVSFYNNSNKFIKTVKVRLWSIIFAPYGATKLRLSTIGCISENSINRLNNVRENGNRLSAFYIASPNEWLICNRVINCIVHDTRSCMVSPCGTQVYINGLITFNVSGQGESKGKLTSQLCDIEDAAMNHYHIWYINWSNIGGLYGTINAQRGNDICLLECPGIGITHVKEQEVRDGLISNSIMGTLKIKAPSLRIIRKNIQITNNYLKFGMTYTQNGFTYPTVYYLKKCFIANMIGDSTIEEINNTENTPIKINNYGN